MANPTLHDLLVEHARFPFPETSISGSATSTDISDIDVGSIGSLRKQWKALHAVRDNDLAKKLCDTLKDTLGKTPLTEDSKRSLLRCFLPTLRGDGGRVAMRWLNNPSRAHVSIILDPSLIQTELLGKSQVLLRHGVFSATEECLWQYDQLNFGTRIEQRVEGARSVVDFHH